MILRTPCDYPEGYSYSDMSYAYEYFSLGKLDNWNRDISLNITWVQINLFKRSINHVTKLEEHFYTKGHHWHLVVASIKLAMHKYFVAGPLNCIIEEPVVGDSNPVSGFQIQK